MNFVTDIMATSTNLVSTGLVELMTLTGSLGAAIIIFTIILRSILLPLTLPSLKAQKKMRDLKPELDELKKKHGKDKKTLQQAQVELYQKYNVNPLAGCLPQLAQIAVLIVLYRALITFLGETTFNGVELITHFWWLDLRHPDTTYILPVVAGVSQLFLSLMIAPGGEVKDEVPNDSKSKKVQKENEKEEDMAEMAASMQQQMIFIMPAMTAFIATRFPSGLALYWVATTIFSIAQQYFISGPGGLVTYWQRAQLFITKAINK
jgi:YidC/Oxa1 family membrane protein insertase